MGFVCPVCSALQADGEHLANHLAFSAMLHGDAHETWLDSHVPDWSDRDPGSLTSAVAPLTEETDHELVSEGSTDTNGPDAQNYPGPSEQASLDPETRRIIEEAADMTREMRSAGDRERSGDDQTE